ncbi:MAG: Signal transduction histidine kinase [Candidatus Magasanikbacteria bacterium GW2011_GWC2_40_17]|uniref:histidine kinase n=1 Tax=Candidatus Magasanikbacteria bacterium GW2011_GWA2_42_32 TaxID=1619039 RepID=A0A0G1A886_9BACT|nr:MAG: Signal transduction histidine kinase [Candidatus Magasanikbacteria bacterium GW2011_GWC2_40_17]KKS57267.1 MAG: Signal transduction histidine kinase [Candidatus Magasanikbacteria bacterium GW2011_GWA2_42_32]OGH86156.1 MAG: hypothetical protein A2294_02790 [Candidatus Magasanikbacteria bacterium RIFOXYB2_FULL_38_10]
MLEKNNGEIILKNKSDIFLKEAKEIHLMPFKELDLYDKAFVEVESLIHRLTVGRNQENEIVFSSIKSALDNLLKTRDLSRHLSKKMKGYFTHDAKNFRRAVIDMSKQIILEDICEDYLKGKEFTEQDLEYLLERWVSVKKNWEAYRLIMEDLFLRGENPAEVMVRNIDQEKDIGRLVKTLEWLLGGFDGGFHKSGPEYLNNKPEVIYNNITAEEATNLKIKAPHGLIFNILQNCLSNALRSDIKNMQDSRVQLIIERDGQNLVFKFSDNGIGIPKEIQGRIFDEKFSTKEEALRGIEEGGKGLAYADKRLLKVGGNIEVMSPDTDGGWNTTFKITVPIVG